MNKNIINKDDPYTLDFIDDGCHQLVALTRKNANFIEAVVRLDSNYSKNFKNIAPDKGFDPETNDEKSSGKSCGSIQYWFEEMKKDTCDFKKCILGAIIAIDRTNSTHLESAKNGRLKMRDFVCEHCSNYKDLVDMLNIPFNSKNHNHLLSLLSVGIEDEKNGNLRNNLSFASKFCSYAAQYLEANISYSKYDRIVSKSLPLYVKMYLNEDVNKDEFIFNYDKSNKNNDEGVRYQEKLNLYEKYENTITRIIEKLRSENIFINKEEFDHIIWYSCK